MFDLVGRKKFDAWGGVDSLFDTDSVPLGESRVLEAKRRYVRLIETLSGEEILLKENPASYAAIAVDDIEMGVRRTTDAARRLSIAASTAAIEAVNDVQKDVEKVSRRRLSDEN